MQVRIILENLEVRVEISTFGGHMESLYHKSSDRSYLWSYQSDIWSRRTSICFPICGALPEGGYTYEGKSYAMPMHGFLREKIFTVVEQSSNHVILECNSDQLTERIYPFSFAFWLEYQLSDCGVVISYKIKNRSADRVMPFSVGSHYAYLLDGEDTDYQITFRDTTAIHRRWVSGSYLTPEKQELPNPCIISVADVNQDSYIFQYPKGESPFVCLKNKKTRQEIMIRFMGFEYCLLWRSEQQAPFVCIEPWSGIQSLESASSALFDRTSITSLKPEESAALQIELSVI
jgi:galactose mutarotase-like enzyme